MIAPGLARSLTALMLLPGTALGGAGFSTVGARRDWPGPPRRSSNRRTRPRPPTDEAVPLVFGEVLDVRVVNVEVVVTDKDGERVRGLDAKDFRLKVDGKEVPIDYFSEILGGEVVTRDRRRRQGRAVAAARPAGRHQLPGLHRRLLHASRATATACSSGSSSRRQAIQPEDRMAVVAFDGQELTMLTTWTNSERVLQDALRKARARPTTGLMRMAELNQNDEDRRQRRDLETTTLAFLDQEREHRLDMQLDPVELGYATRLIDQLERSVDAAIATLRGFADPPGRKAMILLSGGWPYNPAEYTVNDYDADFVDVVSAGADPMIPVGRQLYGDLANAANLLGYTLYPVDVPGMQRDSRDASVGAPSNEQAGVDRRLVPARAAEPRQPRVPGRGDRRRGAAQLAPRRGVRARHRRHPLLLLARLHADAVAGRPAARDRGRGRCARASKVRSREGFLDFSKPKELTMMVESALLFGSPPSTTPLELKFGSPKKAGGGKMSLPLEVGIPMESVTMIEVGGKYAADLELRITVMDQNGGRSDTPVAKIEIRGDRPPRQGEFFRYVTDLGDAPQGAPRGGGGVGPGERDGDVELGGGEPVVAQRCESLRHARRRLRRQCDE